MGNEWKIIYDHESGVVVSEPRPVNAVEAAPKK
jgi:hypothetical protein